MLTRSFLFLLAMVTGFSAAQAGDNLRQPQTASAAASVLQSATVLWSDEAKPAKTNIATLQSAGFDLAEFIALSIRPAQIVVIPRIHIGDRNRQ